MRCPSAYVWHLILAARASSLESAGSICDTHAHGTGTQSLWALMKFVVSVFTVDYPEYKTLLFLAVTMRVSDPCILFQTLDFSFPNLQRNWSCNKKTPLHQIFCLVYLARGQLFSTKPLWSLPASSEPFPTRGSAALTTPRRGCQWPEWGMGGWRLWALQDSPACTQLYYTSWFLSQVITGR